MKDYIHLGNDLCIARNRGAASTSLCKAAFLHGSIKIHLAANAQAAGDWHERIRRLIKPAPSKVVLLVVRDPVDRFAAACARLNIAEVDALIKQLETKPAEQRDPRLMSQYEFVDAQTLLYRFDQDLSALAERAGFPEPLPVELPQSPGNVPSLAADQLRRVRLLYSKDEALYESIETPGQAALSSKMEVLYKELAAAFGAMPIGKRVLWEPVRAAISQAITSGDIETARSIFQTMPSIYPGADKERRTFLRLLNSHAG